MNNELIKGYVCLADRKKELDAELKRVGHDLKEMTEKVIDEIHNAGFESVTIDGRKVTIKEDLYARARGEDHELVAALRASGLEQYVAPESYNESSISKYVREIWNDLRDAARGRKTVVTEESLRAALPEHVSKVLKISFVYKLSNTQA